ncbi:methylated-DNA--[protein]-cysteine S-methyltransferase [Halobacillus amylolyticus]|uniref:Methylated-DNA--[protein]-cysteine S-methyltransferase n=1 Tax=Halobacillus amylolyticus TaxID=2932259 RepID=A0ABY4H7D1_9BACI|nr:methylated-DNA--[protein]-cysteine S-methyltransferase [Halobacillus amylolyticus]UOR10348.1 methylated-DNA--[protein]-cysteine S-methyltransferase [Halobacillus amylolyticus]
MNYTKGNIIYWSLLEYENWNFYMATTSKGLCYVGSHDGPFKELKDWTERRFPGFELLENHGALQPFKGEWLEYFQGKREWFTFAVNIQGTAFQQEVWEALQQIPYGETYTYSQLADMIHKPSAVRAVGAAVGANPVLIAVPCHRVIGKTGALTGYRGGLEMKKYLLELEKENGSSTNV